MLASHIMKSRCRNIVGLPFTHQAVVLEDVLFFRIIDFGLVAQDSLGLTPGQLVSISGLLLR